MDRGFSVGHFAAFVISEIAFHFLAKLSLAYPWTARL
jgi:hypothetical protein